MQRSPAAKRNKLISLPILVLLVAAMVGLLYHTLQRGPLELPGEQDRPTELSLAYLRMLVAAKPGEPQHRVRLARQLVTGGRPDEAAQVLVPLLPLPDASGRAARALDIRIRAFTIRALPSEAARRAEAITALRSRIQDVARETEEPEELEGLALIAAEMGDTRGAAQIAELLADRDLARQTLWLVQAARWAREASDEGEAARLLEAAALAELDPEIAAALFLDAAEAILAAGRPDLALAICERAMGLLGERHGLLEAALSAARQADLPERARGLGRRMVLASPTDAALLEAQVDRELAAGDPASASALAERALKLSPNHRRLRGIAARAAEWAGTPEQALSHWRWLAAHGATPEELDHVVALARSLYRLDVVQELLVQRVNAGRAGERTLLELAEVHERLGRPEDALELLRSRTSERRRSKAVWTAMAELELHRGETAAAVELWKESADRFDLTVAEATHAAALCWKLGRPEEGLALLRQVRARARRHDSGYWALTGELAWTAHRHAEAYQAYGMLWSGGVRSPQAASRLFALWEKTSPAGLRLQDVAAESWRLWSEPSLLLQAANRLAEQGDAVGALAILDLRPPPEDGKPLEESWMVRRAELLQEAGLVAEAREAFWKTLVHHPDSTAAAVSLLWLCIDTDDLRSLQQEIEQLRPAAANAPALWSAFAVGLSRLELYDAALPWFDLQARQAPGDVLWLLAYADALEQAGHLDAAAHLRRHALVDLHRQAWRELQRPAGARDKKVLQARAILARKLEGVPAGYAWLAPLLRDAREQDARQLAVAWYTADAKLDRARGWLMRQHAERIARPEWRALAAAILEQAPGDSGEPFTDEPATPRPVPVASTLRVVTQVDQLPELTLLGARANATLSLSAWAGLEGEVAAVQLRSGPAMLLGPDPPAEVDVLVGPVLERSASRTWLRAGANLRRGSTIGRAEVGHRRLLTSHLVFDAGGSFNRMVLDSAQLRTSGARHEANLGLTWNPTQREYALASGGAFLEATRSSELLASGLRASVEVGHRLMLANPQWRTFVTASWTGRRLVDEAPPELGSPPRVEPCLPPRLMMAGMGTQLERGALGVPGSGSFPHAVLGIWGGYIHPARQAGFWARGGIGIPLFAGGELSLEGYYSIGVGEVAGGSTAGAMLTYTRGN